VRIGGDDEIKVDVRIICTTNRDLKQEVENGTFREDLFYRLSVVPVHIPPLRERKEDIPDLLNYFIGKLNEENGYAVEEASEETVAMLQKQPWPGNIRQLENAIERAMVFCKSGILKPDFFDIEPAANAAKPKKK
ncbi:MAG: sigma 54-interacting transcriptional regulator, partial [Fibromonadales bacterium]|nr:sigma 54-interacting transcriptional regulator [Fibromonadales bacterium]